MGILKAPFPNGRKLILVISEKAIPITSHQVTRGNPADDAVGMPFLLPENGLHCCWKSRNPKAIDFLPPHCNFHQFSSSAYTTNLCSMRGPALVSNRSLP